MQSRPEVVVTGLGAVTPAGLNVEESWDCLLRGERRTSALEIKEGPESASYPVGLVKGFVPSADLEAIDRSVQFGLRASAEALDQAGLSQDDEYRRRAGCVFSLSKPPPERFSRLYRLRTSAGSLVGTYRITEAWPNAGCVQIADRYQLIGPRLCLPAACATGTHAVIRAAGLILDGQLDCVLAGAAEASLTPLYLAAFARMGVLANDRVGAERACRPFDRHRSGLVPAEGAAALVLESATAARKRGAKILARISGYWQGMHALDLLQLEPDGHSLAVGLRQVLRRSELTVKSLDYICAHGTGTMANDASETEAIKSALGPAARRLSISSHKGAIGHTLAAAGVVQIVLTVKSLRQGLIPPTINLEYPDPVCDLDYTPGQARQRLLRQALCITGGFGGQCGLVVVSRAD
jgi:3-oxoacyl-(acyl-carrier-protein) synthase